MRLVCHQTLWFSQLSLHTVQQNHAQHQQWKHAILTHQWVAQQSKTHNEWRHPHCIWAVAELSCHLFHAQAMPQEKLSPLSFLMMIFMKAVPPLHGAKDTTNFKQTIAEWYHYAKTSAWTNAKQAYQLPCDAADLSELETRKFTNCTLCLSAPWQLFDLGHKKWEGIKKIANSYGVSFVHKAKCKPSNRCFNDDNTGIFALWIHFFGFNDLSKPLTMIVCKVTGKVTEHDNDNTIYLPCACRKSFSTIHSVKVSIGHTMQQAKTITGWRRWVKVNHKTSCAWVTTYQCFWECEFPYLNVNKRRYNICNLCFVCQSA